MNMGLVAVALGVVLVIAGFWLRIRGRKVRAARVGWPSARGAVQTARITLEEGGENSGSYNRFSVWYGYSVAGAAQKGFAFSDRSRDHPALVKKYSAGAPVEVFYDPAKPASSEVRDPVLQAGGLEAGLYRFGLVAIPIGSILAVIGLAIGIVF
jgi:hypothetical protein